MYRKLWVVAAGLVVLVGGPAVAAPQNSPAATVLEQHRPPAVLQPQPPPQVQPPPTPLFRIFGIPVAVDAPVAPPYRNIAYRVVGGQPGTGGDSAIGIADRLSQRFGPD